ncbi:MAG: hypothetical protein KKF44_08040 [Nanoarchaeota archaeon]|nr:hypothetical protein [Nanoarchaeota archaeon]
MKYQIFRPKLSARERVALAIERWEWRSMAASTEAYVPLPPYPCEEIEPKEEIIEIIPEKGETIEEILYTMAIESYKTSIPQNYDPAGVIPAFPNDEWVAAFDPSAFYRYAIMTDYPRRGPAKLLDLFLPPRKIYREIKEPAENGIIYGLSMNSVDDGHFPSLGSRITMTELDILNGWTGRASILFYADKYRDSKTYVQNRGIINRDPYKFLEEVQKEFESKKDLA